MAVTNRDYNKIDDQDWIVEYSKNLKRNFANDKDYADLDDLQVAADYYGCNFTVYDNLFHISAEITAKTKKSKKQLALTG